MKNIMTVKNIQKDREEYRIALVQGTIGEIGGDSSDEVAIAEGVFAKVKNHKTFDVPAIATVGMPLGNELAMVLVHVSEEFLDFCETLFLKVQSQFLDKPFKEGSLTFHVSETVNFSVWLLPVRETIIRKIFPDISAYYEEMNQPCPPYWQIVLADLEGRFPWEEACAAEMVLGQQIFGDLDEEKAKMLKKSAAIAYETLVKKHLPGLCQKSLTSCTASRKIACRIMSVRLTNVCSTKERTVFHLQQRQGSFPGFSRIQLFLDCHLK